MYCWNAYITVLGHNKGFIFMPPPTKWPEALCFRVVRPSVRPSVRPYVRPSVRTSRSRDRVISRTDWRILTKLGTCMYLGEPMIWLDFGVMRSKVKGHRAHYICKNSSWSRYLKNQLTDSYQTWYMYVSWKANDLIRFWGHEVKGHRAHYICENSLWWRYLKNRLMDSFQTWYMYVYWRANDLISFLVMRSKVKGHRAHYLCKNRIAW